MPNRATVEGILWPRRARISFEDDAWRESFSIIRSSDHNFVAFDRL